MARSAYERGTRFVSLNAVTATGAGDEIGFSPYSLSVLPRVFAFDVLITGAPTAVTVNLEGSLDGTNWFALGTTSATTNSLNFVVDKPVLYVRANLATLTGGTSPTISCGVAA